MEVSQVYGRADHRCGCVSMRPVRRLLILACKHGVWEATFYNWKSNYIGGMDVSEAKRLRQLQDENAKLKKLMAEQMLDAAALREVSV